MPDATPASDTDRPAFVAVSAVVAAAASYGDTVTDAVTDPRGPAGRVASRPSPSCCSPRATGCRRSITDEAGAGARSRSGWPAGTGPVAVDAERASGYRYGQRAYLVQLRRAGVGTAMIDPIGLHRPVGARRRPGRRRVGAARGQPGPALPGRGRHAAAAHLRHRAGRAAGRLRAGRPRRDGRAGARAAAWRRGTRPPTGRAGRCRSRGCVRRARRRGAHRAARRARGRARRAGQARLGPRGVRRRWSRRRPRSRAPTRGGAPPASTASATAASWPPSARCGRSATRSPATATSRRAGCCPTPRCSPR